LAVALIAVDSITVGGSWDGDDPLWASNSIRVPILAWITALCGAASLEGWPPPLHFRSRILTYLAILLMVASSAYALSIGYLMTEHNPNSWGLEGELLLQVVVFYLVLRAQKLKVSPPAVSGRDLNTSGQLH
jgi:hypothetical protein